MPRRIKILVTRAEPDASVYADEIEEMGLEARLEPMLQIRTLPFSLRDMGIYQALVFTSAQGVGAFCEKAELREIPVYVVGANTKEMAQEYGFADVISADGAADTLAALIDKKIADKTRPLLHVRGEHGAQPLDEMLAKRGVKLDTLVVYMAEKVDEFSAGFSLDDIDLVTFFSKRTAENFMRLVKEAKMAAKLKHIKVLCISEAVLKCVQPELWEQTYIAETPDRQGMHDLLQRLYMHDPLEEATMSNNNNAAAIENAEEVIERFGGIRPMAKKIDVAVTTIQGWKKRNVIPGTRRDQILEAAQSHDVDLSDIVQGDKEKGTAANENVGERATFSRKKMEQAEAIIRHTVPKTDSPRALKPGVLPGDLDERFAETEKNAVTKSTWINAFLILVAIVAVIALLWPSPENYSNESRFSALENSVDLLRDDVDAVKVEQSFLSTLIPKDLDQRLARLQLQAQEARERIGGAAERVSEVSDALLDGDIADFASSPQVASLLNKFRAVGQSAGGQQQLGRAVAELNALLSGLSPDNPQLDDIFSQARNRSSVLSQTFEGVPAEDMKAAALLLGMAQFRQSLNRDNQPFDQDLQLLISLVGNDNPELAASLQKLAPHAEQGVLTPAGLTNEFKTIAGDTVIASLSGEDVSFSDKAKARFNEIFQVEKDGELITGTPVQATVAKAESLLEAGDIQGAVTQMETLQGSPRVKIEPWLDEARATLLAQQVRALMNGSVSAVVSGGAGPGGSRLIQDKESGINILKRPKPLLPRSLPMPTQ